MKLKIIFTITTLIASFQNFTMDLPPSNTTNPLKDKKYIQSKYHAYCDALNVISTTMGSNRHASIFSYMLANSLYASQSLCNLSLDLEKLITIIEKTKPYAIVEEKEVFGAMFLQSLNDQPIIQSCHGPISERTVTWNKSTIKSYQYVISEDVDLINIITILQIYQYARKNKTDVFKLSSSLEPYIDSDNICAKKIASSIIYPAAKTVLAKYIQTNTHIPKSLQCLSTHIQHTFSILNNRLNAEQKAIMIPFLNDFNEGQISDNLLNNLIQLLHEDKSTKITSETLREKSLVTLELLYQIMMRHLKTYPMSDEGSKKLKRMLLSTIPCLVPSHEQVSIFADEIADENKFSIVLFDAMYTLPNNVTTDTIGNTLSAIIQSLQKKNTKKNVPKKMPKKRRKKYSQKTISSEKSQTVTPPNATEPQKTCITKSPEIAPETNINNDLDTHFIYAPRVLEQYKNSKANKDIYHGYSWKLDPYVMQWGQKTTKTSNSTSLPITCYAIPGHLEWKEQNQISKRFIVIALCKDHHNIVYHRGLIYSEGNNLIKEHQEAYGYQIDFPPLKKGNVAAQANTKKIFAHAKTNIMEDHPYYISIYDKNLEKTITLFKINDK